MAKDYHEETNHSEASVRTGYLLDWEDRPYPYKVYSSLAPIFLPKNFPRPIQGTIDCVKAYGTDDDCLVDLETVAEMLYFAAGLTKKIKLASGETYDFRAAASTGALYEIELYVVCDEIPGLNAGVYHFNPQDFALRQLRSGDHRHSLYEATGSRTEILSASISVILTAIHWRNAWKYRTRSYRHFYWDGGTIIANLFATAIAANLKANVILGFQDELVNHLLGADTNRESALALVPLGQSKRAKTDPEPQTLAEISHEYVPLSKREMQYPEVLRIHSDSSLNSMEEVASWQKARSPKLHLRKRDQLYPLQALGEGPQKALGSTIIQRGSTRRFSREPIPFGYLSTILQASTNGIPADFLNPSDTLLETYLIVNAVEGLQLGTYYYDREKHSLELLKSGDFREKAGHLCLEQDLGADGSVAVFLMSNLNLILEAYGNRGYRAAQLEAGIVAGKMYLCAYALEMGASGITFYDDLVTDFFSPDARGKSTMLSVILGIPAYGKRSRDVISRINRK